MGLFYVTVLKFYFWVNLPLFFKGVFGKARVLVWCFDGSFVVECVVIVDRRHHVMRGLKTCHEFQLYFEVKCGKGKGEMRGISPLRDSR